MAYTLTGEKCGTVRLDPSTTGLVVTESVQRSSKVTTNPIESGSDINDHVVNDPIKFTLTGITINGDGQAAILRRMWKENDILEYVGRNRIASCVITSYKSDANAKNKGGSNFTLQLQVINRTSSEYVATGAQLMSAQDADASKASGVSSGGQTKATTADGLHSTVSETISSSAYAGYVAAYSTRSGNGPATRATPSYSAA